MKRSLILLTLGVLGGLTPAAAQTTGAASNTLTIPVDQLSPQGQDPALLLPQTANPAPRTTLTGASLGAARFVTLPARAEGNLSALTPDQANQLAAAINRTLPTTLKQKYPAASVTSASDAGAVTDAGAVQVTPVVSVPGTLNIFSSVDARLELRLPGDPNTYVVKRTYSVLSLLGAGGNADSVALGGLTAQLP